MLLKLLISSKLYTTFLMEILRTIQRMQFIYLLTKLIVKRKIQRFVPNTIVIKNPIPDQLTKPTDIRLDKNIYIDKNTNEPVTFPRISSFEIYIFNVLIFSKLKNNTWPNHYKILQLINDIIIAKRNGLPLDQYSVHNQLTEIKVYDELAKDKNSKVYSSLQNSPMKKHRILSKKKKIGQGSSSKPTTAVLINKINPYQGRQKNMTIDHGSNNKKLDPLIQQIRSKRNSIILKQMKPSQTQLQKLYQKYASSSKTIDPFRLPVLKNNSHLKQQRHRVFNSLSHIDQFSQQQISIIQNKGSILQNYNGLLNSKNRYMHNSNVNNNNINNINNNNNNNNNNNHIINTNPNASISYQNQSIIYEHLLNSSQNNNNKVYNNHKHTDSNKGFNLEYDDNNIQDNQLENMKFVQNIAVQYNDDIVRQSLKNQSIQYEINQQALADYGIQLDQKDFPKDIDTHLVQTQHVDILDPQEQARKALLKPVFEDSAIQTNIIVKKRQKQIQIQTYTALSQEQQMNTEIKQYLNRGYQFPDEQYEKKKLQKINISLEFINLYEKRRALAIDNLDRFYSVDRFQEKATKQKWIGKAKENQFIDDIRKKMFIQSMLFGVYNFFGIKTPQKRLEFLKCTNIVGEKVKYPHLYHTLTKQLDNVNYLYEFEQYSLENKKYPLSEELTFKNSKKRVRFNNWGKFLAITYLLQDSSIFQTYSNDGSISFTQNPTNLYSNIAVHIQNNQVKQIYRLTGQNYLLHPSHPTLSSQQQFIYIDNQHKNFIDVNRLSKYIQLQFISMLTRIIMSKTREQLKTYLREIFVNKSRSYDNEKIVRNLDSVDFDGAMEEAKLKVKENNNEEYRQKSVSLKYIQEKYKQKNQKVKQLVQQFISKLDQRIQFIQKVFQGKIYTYQKYESLNAKINYSMKPNYIIDRKYNFKDQKQITKKDIAKYLQTFNNFLILSGNSGSGKSYLMNEVKKQLQQTSVRCNVVQIKKIELINLNEIRKFVQQNVKDMMKNFIFISDVNFKDIDKVGYFIKNFINVMDFVDMKVQIAYFIAMKNQQLYDPLVLKISGFLGKSVQKQQKFAHVKIMPLQNQQITKYLAQSIQVSNKNIKLKQEFIENVIEKLDKTPALKNIFYLTMFCRNINPNQLQEEIYSYNIKNATKFVILKKNFQLIEQKQKYELKNMKLKPKKIFQQLRSLVLKLYFLGIDPTIGSRSFNSEEDYKNLSQSQLYSNLQQKRNKLAKQFFQKYQQEILIKNQLQFYPIDLKFIIKKMSQKVSINQKQKNVLEYFSKQTVQLFLHSQFFNYLLVQSFTYYMQKGYRNLNINLLLSNPLLLSLIQQKYSYTQSHSQILSMIYQSQNFPSLCQQSSNSFTLLNKLHYTFSNLSFQSCHIPFADLSCCTFYNCSFKSTNLNNCLLYRTQFLNCNLDNSLMQDVNLLMKKYDVEFTPLCCSISHDGKNIALGCGNYLIFINVQTGKQIKKIQAHLDIIRSVNYSKDGKSLITIADDKTVRTWDTVSYKEVVFKLNQKGPVYYNEESQMIASVNQTKLKVWDIKSMANQSICSGHADLITSVSFSYHGQYILTGSKDTTLRLWNLQGKQLHLYKSHTKQIICGHVSPNDAIIVSSSKSKQLILFHLQSQSLINRKSFPNQITQICPDFRQKYIIIIFSQQNQISILNYQNLQIEHKLIGHTNKIISIDFDPNFQKLVSLSKDRTFRVWEIKKIMKIEEKIKKDNQKILKKGIVNTIMYNQNNGTYITGHQCGEIVIWNQQTHEIITELKDNQGTVSKVVYDSQNKIYSAGKDGILRIWDLQKSKSPRKIQISSADIFELKINEKNNLIVLCTSYNQLVIYDLDGTRLVHSTREQGRINSVAFSQNDRYLAVGGNQKYVVLYKIQTVKGQSTIQKFQQLGEHPQPITHIVFQGDTFLISALKSGHLFIWNYLKTTLIKKIENNIPITSMDVFSYQYLCLSSQDGKIRFINMQQAKQVKAFRYKQACASFSFGNQNQASKYLFAIYKDGNMIKWNLDNVVNSTTKNSISIEGSLQSSIMISNMSNNKKKIKFGRKAVNLEGSLMVEIEGCKQIKIKNLFDYNQEILNVENCPDTIEGVGFDQENNFSKINAQSIIRQEKNSQNKSIVLLLKNGLYWSLTEGKQSKEMKVETSQQGDLVYIKDNFSTFYKSGVKKVKNIRKPTLKFIEEITIG